MMRSGNKVFFALLLIFTAGGCRQSPGSDEEELEHQVPPHKPRTLAAAVIELERRDPGLPVQNRASSGSESISLRQELDDILRWLPELGADSDLKKENWDTLQYLAIELERLINSQESSSAAGGITGGDNQFSDAYRKIVAKIRAISDLTVESAWPIDGGATIETDPPSQSNKPVDDEKG